VSKIDQLEGHHCCWYGGMFQEHRVTLKMLSPEGEAVQSRVSGVSTNCYANKSFDDCLEINLRSAYQPQAPQSSIILDTIALKSVHATVNPTCLSCWTLIVALAHGLLEKLGPSYEYVALLCRHR